MHLHLTEKAPMVSIPKVISVMSCGVLLCLGLSSAAQADNAASVQDEMKADQSDLRQGGQEVGEKQMSDEMKGGQSKSGMTIKGEVLRVEGDTHFEGAGWQRSAVAYNLRRQSKTVVYRVAPIVVEGGSQRV